MSEIINSKILLKANSVLNTRDIVICGLKLNLKVFQAISIFFTLFIDAYTISVSFNEILSPCLTMKYVNMDVTNMSNYYCNNLCSTSYGYQSNNILYKFNETIKFSNETNYVYTRECYEDDDSYYWNDTTHDDCYNYLTSSVSLLPICNPEYIKNDNYKYDNNVAFTNACKIYSYNNDEGDVGFGTCTDVNHQVIMEVLITKPGKHGNGVKMLNFIVCSLTAVLALILLFQRVFVRYYSDSKRYVRLIVYNKAATMIVNFTFLLYIYAYASYYVAEYSIANNLRSFSIAINTLEIFILHLIYIDISNADKFGILSDNVELVLNRNAISDLKMSTEIELIRHVNQ